NDPVSNNAIDLTGWTQFGFQTEDGVTINYEAEFLEEKVQEFNDFVIRELVGEMLQVNFNLKEADLEQMALAIPGATYTEGATPGTNPNVLKIGDPSDPSLVEYSLAVRGKASTGANNLLLFFPKMTAVGPVE